MVYITVEILTPIGKCTGVSNLLGVNVFSVMAWWQLRMVYLGTLPRVEEKVFVALDETLHMCLSQDLVQYRTTRSPTSPTGAADLKQPARTLYPSLRSNCHGEVSASREVNCSTPLQARLR